MKRSTKQEYDHSKIEKKWQKEWAKKKVFKSEDNSNKEKFYILDMFPYVSGEGIHVGHPKGYIATDIVSRMKRKQGFNVLHPMGFDAFGLPAENYAIKTKTNPMVFVKKNIDRFKKQLEGIGFDYDWSREINTSDPKYYKWTQWIFLRLLEKGLAYESNEPVNWCPVDKTVLANEDVENGKCERCGSVVEKRPIRQWVLKITDYAERLLADLKDLDWPESIKESQRNWIGKSIGAEIKFKIIFDGGQKPGEIPIFTTRPETIFGAGFLALAPEHLWVTLAVDDNHIGVLKNRDEVIKYITEVKNKTEIERTDPTQRKTGVELRGVKAVNPANGEEIPIWIADFVLPQYGTGAIFGDAHDERDFQFGKKYGITLRETVIPKVIDKHDPPKEGVKTVERKMIQAIVVNPKNKKILLLKWKKHPWTTFITGGIDENEDVVEAAKREILEETGYKNIKFARYLGGPVESHYFANHKNENRKAVFSLLVFEIENEEKSEVSDEEKQIHEAEWATWEELSKDKNTKSSEYEIILDRFFNPPHAWTGDGVLVNSGKFSGMTTEEAREQITTFVGGKIVTKYKLRDWVFSRQRYWGEPIPVLRDGDEVIPVSDKELPVVLPKVKFYEPTGAAESPLANVPKWINVKVGKKILKRESNTMPQWAGSSWYYLRYMDPANNKSLVDKKKEKYWNSVNLYVGGAEHATRHLIYARFWHKFLYDIGVVSTKEPFIKLQHVGLIIASDGRKMSKRWGNIINPVSIISTYGADTLRMYEMFMGPFDQAVSWSDENILGVRRFLERVWRLMNKVSAKDKSPQKLETLVHKTIKKVSEDIEKMAFNTAVSSMMILVNEMEKSEHVNQGDFEMLLQILNPFAPHITEEIWNSLGHKTMILKEKWPTPDPKKILETSVIVAIQVNSKVRAEFEATMDMKEEEIVNIAKKLPSVEKWLEGKEIKKVIYVPNKLVNFVIQS